jgi:endonuclease/exonuclease/phosphatase (EEP) superfamily protein YafD
MRLTRLPLAPLLWPPFALLSAFSAVAATAGLGGRADFKLDLFAQFAAVWLAGSLIALVAAAFFRGPLRWGVAIPALVGVSASVVLMLPEFLRDTGPRAAADAPGQIRIVQMNVWQWNHRPDVILDWLDAERPDIAILEENSPRFQTALAAHPAWHVGCGTCEVMILSRDPALAVGPPPRRGRAHVGPLTRGYFHDSRGVFAVIGVHNAWPTDVGDQRAQEQRLADTIAETGRERLIVAGDFNSTPWSFARRRWDAAFGLTRRERAVFSWPAQLTKRANWIDLPILPIDHVYAGPGWATVSVRRGRPRLSSDHYPLVVTLAPR